MESDRLQVVAAVIRRNDGHILLARRPAHVDQGGLWEFPGGKRLPGEERRSALARELDEELGIRVLRATPLIRIPHDYATHRVLLDVFVVDRWRGQAYGREGQEIRWVAPDALADQAFPAANLPIVTAAQLPRVCVITPPPMGDDADFLAALENCLARGARLVQLRAPALSPTAYRALAVSTLARCRVHGARLMLNAEPALALEVGADGVHLNARRLAVATARPAGRSVWISAACHDADELAHAQRIGVDFVSISPVRPTASHADATPLGWSTVATLLASSAIPAYALGGVGPPELAAALCAGCIGIAGIGAFWHGNDALGDEALIGSLTGGL